MVKPKDKENSDENRPIQSEEDIKDFIWAVKQTPDDYWKLGKKEFETHPVLPLQGLRWDDQLDIYRWEVVSGVSRLPRQYKTMLSGLLEDLTFGIINDKLKELDGAALELSSASDTWEAGRTPENPRTRGHKL